MIELVKEKDLKWDVPTGILAMILGAMAIYSILFTIGMFLYGDIKLGFVFVGLSLASTFGMIWFWKN